MKIENKIKEINSQTNYFDKQKQNFESQTKILIKNMKKELTANDIKKFKIIANFLDSIQEKAFTYSPFELEDISKDNSAEEFKIFFDHPLIKTYIRKLEKNLIELTIRKKINKMKDESLTNQESTELTNLMKQIKEYQVRAKETKYIVNVPIVDFSKKITKWK